MTAPNSTIAAVDDGWARLNAKIDSLGRDGLLVTGPDGWAVKDHLVHLAAWERSLLALLVGVDRSEAMGAGGESDVEPINAKVWAAHRDDTPEDALAHFRDTHASLMSALGALSDDDLRLPYNHYQPNDPMPSPGGDRPVLDWVAGNTYEHYAEHIDWIDQLVRTASAAR